MNIHIETDRLYIRPLSPADEQGMFEMDNDPEVHKYLGNKPLQTIQESRDVIAFVMRQYEEFGIGRWAVIEKATNAFVGWTGYKYMGWQGDGTGKSRICTSLKDKMRIGIAGWRCSYSAQYGR